ncbi:hypothetical protein RND81_01G199200 [Saponaria officinalis]|uniref:F-box domain-containing protein n=1 Tax=Saponaria officinalis TaxID=3572 RepID=A0AAW1NB81_SAPOF
MDDVNRDLLNSLHPDVARKILNYLDDPGDIVRASSVSRAWRDFVISNGLSKHLCLRLFPQLSSVTRVVDTSNRQQQKCSDVGCSRSAELEQLKLEHRVFASLSWGLTSSEVLECLADATAASSTDNPDVSERLTYQLISNFCVVTEINIKSFQAKFQAYSPIYSAKAVRFRMGYRKWRDYNQKVEQVDFSNSSRGLPSADEDFVWTYTSKEFPMAKENRLQNFKLPEPVLCIGGFVQIELLGRVQRQEMDDLFYICVAYVQVLGRPLAPVFSITPLEPSGTYSLLFNPAADFGRQREDPYELAIIRDIMPRHDIGYEEILDLLHGNLGVDVYDSEDEQHDSDEDMAFEFAV